MAQYIRNLARSLMGQVGISVKTLNSSNLDPTDQYMLSGDVYRKFGDSLKSQLSRMSPQTLGRIAVYGVADRDNQKGSLANVHCDNRLFANQWLSSTASGRELLIQIACTTVCAEIGDCIGFDADPRSAEYR